MTGYGAFATVIYTNMVDVAQLVLLFVIVVLAILLVALGIQIFFILKEFRQTVAKANKVLDDTGMITESVSGPISNISNLAAGLKTGLSIAKFFGRKKKASKRFTEDE